MLHTQKGMGNYVGCVLRVEDGEGGERGEEGKRGHVERGYEYG